MSSIVTLDSLSLHTLQWTTVDARKCAHATYTHHTHTLYARQPTGVGAETLLHATPADRYQNRRANACARPPARTHAHTHSLT